MKQTERVTDYYDRRLGLLSAAKYSLPEKYSGSIDNTTSMMKPVTDCALDTFIRGLADEMLTFVDARNPLTLDEAYEYALRVEERQRYTEQARVASISTYRVARQDRIPNRARLSSPYTRQMEDTGWPTSLEKSAAEASPPNVQ